MPFGSFTPSTICVALIEMLSGIASTVTAQRAVFPFAVVTVTVAVPAFTAYSLPLSSTVTTLSSEDSNLYRL